ncbi:phosphorylase family protein [Bythopirellula goksoeyrii]|uniref:5'-methylthioadenosine/S-adenosylhomocysteine nucleosidase n=1 Tax=Bythopirellula goksoeyrii TaxID=1400387 RepID=A0A5B9QJ41_9BACT|nr:AAA family ATPase [Bythopirellula goksoeyrii]QEG38029.1 5'-methylthioadenosine/S-adenosylhomocysteine nucleosidase [Bythopirellula goksoeyrii]
MSDTINVEAVRGKVDFAVITIRPDEYKAVLDRVPDRQVVTQGRWFYEYGSIETADKKPVNVAIARTPGQGQGSAQQVANNMVIDLEPKWFVLVGIAGAFPNDDFSLGDVVLASRIVDFAVQAAIDGGTSEYATGGGPVHRDVQNLLSWIPSQESTLGNWNTTSKLGAEKPTLEIPETDSDERIYGEDDHRDEILKSIRRHFGARRLPKFHDACLATSNTLVKDAALVAQFKQVARHIEYVEMEAGGVFLVCHDHQLPLLCVRGISDIVGFKRGAEWTGFACHTAAAFFVATVKSLPLDVWGPTLEPRQPLEPKKPDTDATVTHSTKPQGLAGLRAEMLRISDWLLRYELNDEERIHLSVEDNLSELDQHHNVSLLLGKPGTGKTCLLARIGNKFIAKGHALLAIKADLFPHNKSLDEWARDELGTDLTFHDLVQTVSAREPVVVLVDQLDALASTVDLTSSRLNDLLVFLARCSRLPNVHVISSCRNFDFSYDPRFRRMNPRTFSLDLPTWDEASEKLRGAGIDADQIQPKLKELLRTPQHLSMFLQLRAVSGARTFETYSEMLGEFWNAVVTTKEKMAFVNQLTKKLVDTESIWAPMAAMEGDEAIVTKLCSAGLLERENNQLRFSHQTIQEYAVARMFAEANASLSEFVLKHQETIFKRPTIWAVLTYLRDNAKEKYASEVDTILTHQPRPHVRFLLVAFFCRQPDPTEHEIAIIGHWLGDEELRLKILSGINNNPAWFEALKDSHLPSIMSDPTTEQWPLLSVLIDAWKFDWDAAFRLIKEYWSKHSEFDGMTLRAMEHCGIWTPEVVSLIERIATRIKQNHGRSYQVETIVGVMSVDAPEDAARLAARVISTPTNEQPESKSRHNSPLESREGWYDLEEIAKAAPAVFLNEITPWLVATAVEFHNGYEGSALAHYVGSCWWLDDREYPRESPILTAIQTCVDIVSKENPETFVSLFRRHWQSENAIVHRIFIDGLMNAVRTCTEDVFGYLMCDDRRFTVGQYGDTQGSQSVRLITQLFPHLKEGHSEQLTDKIRGWSKYKSEIEPCESQLEWDRESRLHLLDAIPPEFRSDSLAQFIEGEKTDLPNWDRELIRGHSGWVKTIPPMEQGEMETAGDDELVDAFSKPKPDRFERREVEGGFEEQGGGPAAADELSKLAETNPSRAAAIVRLLVSKGLTTHIDRTLRGFSASEDRELVFSLVKEISSACDEGEAFRSAASDVLRSHCDDDGLPEEIIVLLESWLAKPWDTTRSVVVDGGRKEWKPEQSFLWANLGAVIIDTDNSYYTLIALTQSLLSKNNPQGDRWIGALSFQLDNEVSYKTWRMFCDSLRFVRASYCSEEMGKALISKLYVKFPQLASETSGCRLLAMLARFLAPDFLNAIFERLTASEDEFDQQAAGELITLCALLGETSEWGAPLLDRHLFQGESPSPAFLVGVAHAASNLWDDLNKPKDCSSIVAKVISFGNEEATNAIQRLFWNEVALPADEQTSAILQKLTEKIETVSGGLAAEVLGQLTDILPHLRPEILAFAQRLVETRFDELRRQEFNAYEVGPYLVEIAMTLQRFDDTRSAGLDLLETLLSAGLDEANKALKDVDAVDEVSPESPRMPRRRRRKR